MGFKIKQLGTPFRTFTANIGPLNLTAGVPVAEIYLGLYASCDISAGKTLAQVLAEIDNIIVTRRGETVIDIYNGLDLAALELAPWNDHNYTYTSGGSSGHYYYVKGLTLPTAFPVGISGEFQLSVATANVTELNDEVLSIAEGQGYYAANILTENFQQLEGKHFHIVKRLYNPTAEGWDSGFDIGTEGDLIGVLTWQTTPEDRTTAHSAISVEQVRIDIGGETVVMTDCLTMQGRQGSRYTGQSSTLDQTEEAAKAACLDQFFYLDFARQPWDCRGKTVTYILDAGSSHDSIRVYPIYLVDA